MKSNCSDSEGKVRKLGEKKKGKERILLIMFLIYIIKSAMFEMFLCLHHMNELVNFYEKENFAKDCFTAQIKILKSKDILQSLLNNLIG